MLRVFYYDKGREFRPALLKWYRRGRATIIKFVDDGWVEREVPLSTLYFSKTWSDKINESESI